MSKINPLKCLFVNTPITENIFNFIFFNSPTYFSFITNYIDNLSHNCDIINRCQVCIKYSSNMCKKYIIDCDIKNNNNKFKNSEGYYGYDSNKLKLTEGYYGYDSNELKLSEGYYGYDSNKLKLTEGYYGYDTNKLKNIGGYIRKFDNLKNYSIEYNHIIKYFIFLQLVIFFGFIFLKNKKI